MKLQKAFFLVIGLAFLVVLGTLIRDGGEQRAQVISGTNSVGVVSPSQGTSLSPGQTIPMTCQVETAPGNMVWQVKFAWFQNNGADVGDFVVDPSGLPTIQNMMPAGSFTKNVTLPSITPGSNFKLQCVAYFYNQTASAYNGSSTQSVSMDFNDGSHAVPGCTDPSATNYNSSATVDDGSCVYPTVSDTTAPSTPTSPTIGITSSYEIMLNWLPSTDNVGVTRYEIYRNNGGSTAINTVTPIAVVSAPSTTYTNTGLLSKKTYKYRIRAVDAAGNLSGLSTTVSGTTLAVVAPASTSIDSATQTSLTVHWTTPVSGEIFDYAIYANNGGSTAINTTTPIAIVPFGTNLFVHQNLSPNTTYKYRVAARDPAANRSPLTAARSGVTLITTSLAPSVPTNLRILTTTSSSVSLSWNASTGGGQSVGYKVFRSTSSGGTFSQVGPSYTTETTFTDSTVASSSTYYYKVQACNIGLTGPTDCSAQSSASAAATTSAAPDTTPPSVPTGLSVSNITANSLSLSWLASTDTGGGTVAGYNVFRSTTQNGSYAQIGTLITGLTYTDTNLTSGATYWYKVRACDTASPSNCSSQSGVPVSGTTLAAPTAPTGVTIGAPTTSSLAVSWNFVTGATSYKVYRMTSGGAVDGTVPAVVVSAPNLTYTVSGLSAGTTYYYAVSAVNAVGESPRSVSASGTTSSPQITVQTIQLVQATGGALIQTLNGGETINIGTQNAGLGTDLSLSVVTDPTVAGSVVFNLQKPDGTTHSQTENALPYSLFGDAGVTTFNPWQDLQVGGYTLTVTPFASSGGTGQVGVPRTIQFQIVNNDDFTPPANPTNVVVTYRSASQIKLGWTNSTSSDVSAYRVYRGGTSVGVVNHPTNTFSDPTVNATGSYSYKVSAVDASNNEAAMPASGSSAPTLSTSFAINSPVVTTTSASIKSSPEASGNSGTQSSGASGVVTNGPVWVFGGTQYWYVDFATGTDGWVNQTQIQLLTDTTAPTATITAPTSNQILAAGTTQITLSVTTNEPATCRWDVNSTTAYASMPNTFTGSGTTSHTYGLLGLTDGTSYTRYVRCQDAAGNAMTSSVSVTFSVATATTSSAPVVTTPKRGLEPSELGIVVNSDNPISSQIASYYATKYGIPTSNIVSVSLGNVEMITSSTFTAARTSVLNQLPSGVQALAFAGEKPYTVRNNTSDSCTLSSHSCMSITSALAMGYATANTGGGTITATSYYNSSTLTPRTTYSYLPTMMLAGRTLSEAQQFINKGFDSNNAYPVGKIYAIQTTDHPRSDARRTDMSSIVPSMFNTGNTALTSFIDNYCAVSGCASKQNPFYTGNYLNNKTDVLGYHTGNHYVPNISNNTVKLGALAEHVTSYGGSLKDSSTANDGTGYRLNDIDSQMPITVWLEKGFVASAGTVQEPWCCDSTTGGLNAKFPVVSLLWENYYTGAGALESYAKSVQRPGQTLFVGDPLTNPWKDPQITYANGVLTINITHIKPGETWKLQSSTNGTSWSDVSGQTSITSPGGKYGLKTVTVSGATAPFYRLVNTNNASLPQIARPVNGVIGGGGQPLSDNTAPSPAPTISSVSGATQTSLSISWSASNDAGSPPVTYKLFRNGTQITTQAGTSYVDTGLSAATSYSYTVSACDSASIPNCTATSASVSGTTSSVPVTGGQTVSGINGPVGPSLTTNITPSANPYGATDYFVSCTGNDSNNGTSVNTPWKTIDKVDAQSKAAGTRVFFKRGCTYYGQIDADHSGTAAAPITYDAYGTGSAPIISGGTLVTGWTVHSGNIYKATVASGLAPKYLFIDEQPQNLARHPNSGFFTTSNIQSGGVVTDSDNTWLSSQAANSLVGANYVGKTAPWSINKRPITANSGSTITAPSISTFTLAGNIVKSGWGYILENKLSFLDQAGEWFYDSATGAVYVWAPGGVNPNNLSVELSTTARGFDVGNARTNIVAKNLVFEHQNERGIHISQAKAITIDGVEIRKSPEGINSTGVVGNPASDAIAIQNSYIHDIYVEGIRVSGRSVIEGNVVENIANEFQKAGSTSNWTLFGINTTTVGSYNTIKRNIVRNIGYIGIIGMASGEISENYVKDPLVITTDGGALALDTTDGLLIKQNILEGGAGVLYAMPAIYGGYEPITKGLYFGDLDIQNTTVEKNIIIGANEGIWIDHNDPYQGNVVKDNIVYGASKIGIGLTDYSTWRRNPPEQPNDMTCTPWTNSPCFKASWNDTVTGNKVYMTSANTYPLYLQQVYDNGTGATVDFGAYANNYYHQPFSTTKVRRARLYNNVNQDYNLAGWQATGEDAGSSASTYTLTNTNMAADIFYNPSLSPMTQSVNGCTANGTPLTGNQTIQPFSALVVEYGNC